MLSAVVLCVAVANRAVAEVPPGFEIVHITDNPNDYSRVPKINNCGEVVFDTWINSGPGEIFLYDNGRLARITNDSTHDAWPDLNADGTLVWTTFPDGAEDGLIVKFEAGELSVIGPGMSPVINNEGQVSWSRFSPIPCAFPASINTFDAGSVDVVFDDGFSNQSMSINGHGDMVWIRFDFCAVPWTSQAMLYSQDQAISLFSEQDNPRGPTINNAGLVAWGDNNGIEMWQGGESFVLTDWGFNPKLNEAGDLHFIRWHEDTGTWQGWLFISNNSGRVTDGEFVQLTSDSFWNTDGDLNDYREVAWQAKDFPESDIYLMRRVRNGDSDMDGDVDLDDFAKFTNCIVGPISTDGLCECRFLDLDHDRDVDWADFRSFQLLYNGNQ